MTKSEYTEYQANVDAFFKATGIHNLSAKCNEEGTIGPQFSWSPCQCCKTPLGGNRYRADGYNPTTKEIEEFYGICEDCIYYAEYGQLGDETMMEIANSTE